jgi:hypothetical protein
MPGCALLLSLPRGLEFSRSLSGELLSSTGELLLTLFVFPPDTFWLPWPPWVDSVSFSIFFKYLLKKQCQWHRILSINLKCDMKEEKETIYQEQDAPLKNTDKAFVQVGQDGEPVVPKRDYEQQSPEEKNYANDSDNAK